MNTPLPTANKGVREPTIRQKNNGAYFVRWGGKDHYLSMDRTTAQRLFYSPSSTHPGRRSAWLDAKQHLGPKPLRNRRGEHGKPLLLVQAAKRFLESYDDEGRAGPFNYFRYQLSRFMVIHGEADLITLTTVDPDRGIYVPPIVPLLDAFKKDLRLTRSEPGADGQSTLSPRTINHDITAVKRLFNWAHEHGLCPAVHWRGVKKLPVRRSLPEDRPFTELMRVMEKLHKVEPLLLPYVALNYLAVARPSEVVSLITDVRADAERPAGRHGSRPSATPHAAGDGERCAGGRP